MSDSLAGFAFQVIYLFSHLTMSDVLDMVVVSVIFFGIFQALHQTRALQLLRGATIVAILGAASLMLLPLNTLGWLIRGGLIAGVIALPILFQDELRKALTGLGQIGRKRSYETGFEEFKKSLLSAVRNLSSKRQGALIVLEGQIPLDDIIATGIPVQAGNFSAELLQTIFYPNTPLHDGAVVIRGNRIVAASCLLPIETEKTGETHLGTRHRAALGLSMKIPDALIVVVSEETSRISVAQAGQFYMGLTPDELVGWLDRFRHQMTGETTRGRWHWLKGVGAKASASNMGVAVVLALVAWLSVTYQTNPPQQVLIEEVPLVVVGPDSGLLLMNEFPDTVNVQVQTTQDRANELNSTNVRAEVNMEGLPAGEHRLFVDVILPDQRSQFLWVKPTSLAALLETEVTQMITPTLEILDLSSLPLGYTVSPITLTPESIQVKGPKLLVEQIIEARLEVSLDERRSDFQVTVAPRLLNSAGEQIKGVFLYPENILVTVPILRGFFSKEVPIQADLETESLEPGYEVRSVVVTPPTVILAGDRGALDSAGNSLNTLPVNLANAFSELTVSVPLVMPAGVSALSSDGEAVLEVTVKVEIKPVNNYLVLEKDILVRNVPPLMTAQLSTKQVTVLIIGPKPLLDEIRLHPELVEVYLDLQGYTSGTYTPALSITSPPDLEVLLFPGEVKVELLE